MTDTEFESPQPKGISRRTVTKAMAWSVPTIALATSVPAYALSGTPPTMRLLGGGKAPGAACRNSYGFTKDYVFLVAITNTETQPITVYLGQTLEIDGDDVFSPSFAIAGDGVIFPDFELAAVRLFDVTTNTILAPPSSNLEFLAGETKYLLFNAGPQGDSNFTVVTGAIYAAWGHGDGWGTDDDHPYSPVPPNGGNFGAGWFGTPGVFSFNANPITPNCYPPYTL